jgi:hypothetical protein
MIQNTIAMGVWKVKTVSNMGQFNGENPILVFIDYSHFGL